jgi:hypothetical protein
METNYFIYKLNVLDEFYIGSTKNPITRFKYHKHDAKNKKYKDKKLYRKMNEIYDFSDTTVLNYEILESMTNCSNKYAREREQYYIDTLKPTLNINNAVKDPEEYRRKNIEYQRQKREKETEAEHQLRLAKKKVWYYENREAILAREKARYKQKRIDQLKEKMKMMEKNIKCLENQNNIDLSNLEIDIEEIDLDNINTI